MFHCFADSVFVNRSRHIVGGSFHILFGLSHGYSDSSMAEHTDVIASVTECHSLFQFYIEVTDDFVNAFLLGIPFGRNIGKCRNQRPTSQVGIDGRISLFFLFRDKGCHLDDFLTGCLLERYSRNHIHVQEIIEYLFYHVVRLANGYVVFLYKDARDSFLFAESSHCFYFFLRDGTFVNYFFSDKTIGSVHRDVSINEISVLQLGEIVDNGFRTSRSDKFLCNPHNPGGRAWTKEELQIADICQETGTLVISDEIHADLTLPPYKHPTFALTSEKARMNSLVFMSPSKAFNMPGLASSYVIIENEELLQRFRTYMEASEFCEGHLFAYLSVAAAYSHGTEWLDQVIAYIKGNVDFTENYLREHIPAVKMIRPQASYLIFLDCRELGLNQESLNRLFVERAHLALNDGTTFGKEGEGFMRLNVACPRATLEQALKQLERAVNNE